MGLIIKDKIPMFKVGYPTVSDKYNVSGGIMEGNTAVSFGDLVKYGSTTGYYAAAAGAATISAIAGFVLATNVKLAADYPATTVVTKAGEAFNLLLDGYIAIKLDSGATAAQILPGKKVHVILATGKCTTADKYNAGTIEPMDATFTGVYETVGSDVIAEIIVK